MVAAASPFLGQGENAVLVRPFIKDMTRSELHQVMTSGFATIAGTRWSKEYGGRVSRERSGRGVGGASGVGGVR